MSATTSITIGDAARRSGISPESIRHYERIGLLPSPVRGDNGYRYFSQETLDRLATIRAWRDIGMSLDEIRELSAATEGEEMRCETVQRQLLAHAGEVRSRIQSLQTLESLSMRCTVRHRPSLVADFRVQALCGSRCRLSPAMGSAARIFSRWRGRGQS